MVNSLGRQREYLSIEQRSGLAIVQYKNDKVPCWGKAQAGFLAAHYKRCRFLSCEANPQCTQHWPESHCITTWDMVGGKGDWWEHEAHAVCYTVSSKVLCLCPRGLVSSVRLTCLLASRVKSLILQSWHVPSDRLLHGAQDGPTVVPREPQPKQMPQALLYL